MLSMIVALPQIASFLSGDGFTGSGRYSHAVKQDQWQITLPKEAVWRSPETLRVARAWPIEYSGRAFSPRVPFTRKTQTGIPDASYCKGSSGFHYIRLAIVASLTYYLLRTCWSGLLTLGLELWYLPRVELVVSSISGLVSFKAKRIDEPALKPQCEPSKDY